MKNLSERLEAIIEPVWSHEASPADLTALLREAAALAKRYEDAPVGFVMGQGLLTEGNAAIVSMEDPAPVKGKRVRIVLDKEG